MDPALWLQYLRRSLMTPPQTEADSYLYGTAVCRRIDSQPGLPVWDGPRSLYWQHRWAPQGPVGESLVDWNKRTCRTTWVTGLRFVGGEGIRKTAAQVRTRIGKLLILLFPKLASFLADQMTNPLENNRLRVRPGPVPALRGQDKSDRGIPPHCDAASLPQEDHCRFRFLEQRRACPSHPLLMVG
jgi:hypothetical protein